MLSFLGGWICKIEKCIFRGLKTFLHYIPSCLEASHKHVELLVSAGSQQNSSLSSVTEIVLKNHVTESFIFMNVLTCVKIIQF